MWFVNFFLKEKELQISQQNRFRSCLSQKFMRTLRSVSIYPKNLMLYFEAVVGVGIIVVKSLENRVEVGTIDKEYGSTFRILNSYNKMVVSLA